MHRTNRLHRLGSPGCAPLCQCSFPMEYVFANPTQIVTAPGFSGRMFLLPPTAYIHARGRCHKHQSSAIEIPDRALEEPGHLPRAEQTLSFISMPSNHTSRKFFRIIGFVGSGQRNLPKRPWPHWVCSQAHVTVPILWLWGLSRPAEVLAEIPGGPTQVAPCTYRASL